MSHHDELELLRSGAATLGFSLTEEQIAQFFEFAELLTAANQEMNLTSVKAEETISRHFLDSLTLGPLIRDLGVTTLVDVGSGGGFPGLPLAIAFPDLRLTLVDATKKRVEFIAGVIAELGLTNVAAVHGRAETLGQDPAYREQFDLATARALAKLDLLVELLAPFVKVGGHVAAIKSEAKAEELTQALPVARLLGLAEVPAVRVAVPGAGRQNEMWVFKKAAETPAAYPRTSQRMSRGPIKIAAEG